jgi:hypothetical protein
MSKKILRLASGTSRAGMEFQSMHFCHLTHYREESEGDADIAIVEDLASIREDGIFIVDDVAFIQERHAFAVGEAIARKNIHKNYYLETRGDVLLRHDRHDSAGMRLLTAGSR